MSNVDHERFAQWDAAFVLGALSPADRHDYQRHLEQCSTCRKAVAELVPLPGLLAGISPPPSPEPAPPAPTDMLDGMFQKDLEHRRRRRALLGRIAATVATLALVLGIPATLLTQTPQDTVAVELAPVTDVYTTMSVDVELKPAAWGTRLAIACEYPPTSAYADPSAWYGLLVTDTTGVTTQVSTWQAVSDDVVTLDASTAVDLDDIESLTVVTASGKEILTAPIFSQ